MLDPTLTSTNKAFERQVRDTIPGMAHWAGTGPKGKSCGDCNYLIPRGPLGYGCDLYRLRMGRMLNNDIPRQTKACKYFEQREVKHGTRHDRRRTGRSG